MVIQFLPTAAQSDTISFTVSPLLVSKWCSNIISTIAEAFFGPVPCSCENTSESFVIALTCAFTSNLHLVISEDASTTIDGKSTFFISSWCVKSTWPRRCPQPNTCWCGGAARYLFSIEMPRVIKEYDGNCLDVDYHQSVPRILPIQDAKASQVC